MGALFWFNPLRQISSSVGTRLRTQLVRKAFITSPFPQRSVCMVQFYVGKLAGLLLIALSYVSMRILRVFFLYLVVLLGPLLGLLHCSSQF